LTALSKGPSMEEALRFYFIRNGYYTLRSVPFIYRGFDVTDVDIWLYERPSAVSRQRIIVDAKNRKTPQAIERIFWTIGLRTAIAVEQAIVATTDKRPAVGEFGKLKGIVVLDGNFCARLQANHEILATRFSEEEFSLLIENFSLGKLAGNWRERLRASKAIILDGFDYNAVNRWLEEGKFFAEQTLTTPIHKETSCRILYLIVSFIALAIDFLMKDLAFAEPATKQALMNRGFRYGTEGEEGTQRVVNLAIGLVEQYAEKRGVGQRIRSALAQDLNALRTDALAEFFVRQSVAQELFATAKELESAAYGRAFSVPEALSASARSVLSVLLDFWEIDRVKFHENFTGGQHTSVPSRQIQGGNRSHE